MKKYYLVKPNLTYRCTQQHNSTTGLDIKDGILMIPFTWVKLWKCLKYWLYLSVQKNFQNNKMYTKIECIHCTWTPSWITVLLWWRGWHNSMKQWAMPCTATQEGQVIVFWQNVGYWRRKWQTTPVLARRTSWYLKVKRYDTVWWVSQTGKYPICYWKRVEGNY